MPPTPEMIEKAIECLSETNSQFTASPTTVQPGHTSTLHWNVTTPPGCGVQLLLNNSPVSKTGTRSIAPVSTATYQLIGNMFTVRQTLGTVTVTVDTSACILGSLPEDDLRAILLTMLQTFLEEDGRVYSRGTPSIEIDYDGITVRVPLKIAVENFFDPDLDVSMRITLSVQDGQPKVNLAQFDTPVDWPWWVGVITLGVTEFVEGVISDRIRGALHDRLLMTIQDNINSLLALIPAGYRLYMLRTTPNQIDYMVCPG